MTRVSRVVGVVALLGTVVSACGARTGLDVWPVPSVEGQVFAEAGSDVETEASGCTETNVAVEPNVPNLYFVLDISSSMNNAKKWDNIRPAVASLIKKLGPNARFGAAVFPNNGTHGCDPGNEIMPLQLGDSQGATANVFLNATAFSIPERGSGTPTAATFQSLLQPLRNFTGVTIAILATDGGPNCDPSINSCTIDLCTTNIDKAFYSPTMQCAPGVMPNCCDPTLPQIGSGAGTGCLDGDATAQAVSVLRAAGVRTYVMGIPGSAPYASLLDQLAEAGGTARTGEPRYYAVNSPDEAALAAGFQQIAEAAMKSCVLTLHDGVNPDKVNVYVNGALVPTGPEGWSLMGQTLTLEGMTCAGFGMGPADAAPVPIRVTQGCPTAR